MNFSIADIFFVIVIFQLLFISIFLYTHEKGRKLSNRLLASFFLSVSLNLIDSFLAIQKVYSSNPSLAGWGSCLPLLFGPLLFLYTQSVLYKDFRLSLRRWLHFLPAILFFSITEISYLLQSRELQTKILNSIIERNIPLPVYGITAVIFLQFFVYTCASLLLIERYKKIASNHFSDQQRTNIHWLSSTIIFFTVCMMVAGLNGFIGLTPLAKYYYISLFIIVAVVFVFINRVLLKALREPAIFSLIEEKEPSGSVQTNPAGAQYPGSALTTEVKQELLLRLQQHMQTKKPWLQAELTLEQLAGMLSVKPKALSQVINELLQKNFFEFVNYYRIEEAKRLLTNPADKKITVLEVLYEVGFNSKSSFNTIFKKQTGLTPSEFKRRQAE